MQLINGTTQRDRVMAYIEKHGCISMDIAREELGITSKHSFSKLLCKIRTIGYQFSLSDGLYTVVSFKPRVEVKVVDTSYIRRRNLLIPAAEDVASGLYRKQTISWTRAFMQAMDEMAFKELGVKTSTMGVRQ
jgi:hypothetical protein